MDQLKRNVIGVKVQSSTLIEVTTALVIISMVFSMAIVIYVNVQRSGFSAKGVSSMMMIDEVYAESVRTKTFKEREVQFENIAIYQQVTRQNKPDVLLVRLEARDQNGKLVAEKKHLVYAPDPQP